MSYQLANGQTIGGWTLDDVQVALGVFQTYAPKQSPGGVDEEDAMVRALAAAVANRERRAVEDRSHFLRRDQAAREMADLLEAQKRAHARHVENGRDGGRCS